MKALSIFLENGESQPGEAVANLAAKTRNLCARLGNQRVHDSTLFQLDWLVGLLSGTSETEGIVTFLKIWKEVVKSASARMPPIAR